LLRRSHQDILVITRQLFVLSRQRSRFCPAPDSRQSTSLSRPEEGEARVRKLRAEGLGMLKIARTIGVGTSVVQRVVAAGA
jgi:hypothetical protein